MKILLGDIRGEIAKDLQRRIVKVLNQYKHKESYYLLVWAGIDIERNIIRSKLILLSKKPRKMLGTMLYRIDNRIGKIERIWALPLDLETLEVEDFSIEEVLRSAKGMPILKS